MAVWYMTKRCGSYAQGAFSVIEVLLFCYRSMDFTTFRRGELLWLDEDVFRQSVFSSLLQLIMYPDDIIMFFINM